MVVRRNLPNRSHAIAEMAREQLIEHAQELGTDKSALPARGFLVHQGSGEKVEFSLRWDANGSAEGEWAIPAEAKLGVYDVLIGGQVAGDFRVEQFRVPTMKAVSRP